ncbi:mycothiol synthase [Phytoactinopolyspora halophila]|uniref:mycothiol synthase n=1 Tax=Phytoactinopolyspora halophila TaxID=1981511 RepID=UPI001B8BA109|nr:mycothiol synthase [Phytoactinopolyspora halophila]
MSIFQRTNFDPETIERLGKLADRARAVDGRDPFADDLWHRATAGQTRLALSADDDGELAGAAFVADQGERRAAELLVDPERRGQGHGGELLAELLRRVDGELWLWSHGDHPAARTLARRHGLHRARELLQLRRDASVPVPAIEPPPGVTVRTFEPGHDENAWLRVNAAAFASHPEQGSRTLEDLHQAEAEPWFDPAGFFLAVDASGELLGFHWTKIHPPASGEPGGTRVGEVYVLGVAPHAHGQGVGSYLTAAGLRYLASQPGVEELMLYVEGDNAAARRVYERLGFTQYGIDVAYHRAG